MLNSSAMPPRLLGDRVWQWLLFLCFSYAEGCNHSSCGIGERCSRGCPALLRRPLTPKCEDHMRRTGHVDFGLLYLNCNINPQSFLMLLSTENGTLIFYFIIITFVYCWHVHVCLCHGTCVWVRGQLVGSNSLFPSCKSQG